MSELKQGVVVILASANGRDRWQPVLPKDVPDWVKDPMTMGRIVAGDTCMKCDEGEKGSLWYRAATAQEQRDIERLLAAGDKRARRAARVVH